MSGAGPGAWAGLAWACLGGRGRSWADVGEPAMWENTGSQHRWVAPQMSTCIGSLCSTVAPPPLRFLQHVLASLTTNLALRLMIVAHPYYATNVTPVIREAHTRPHLASTPPTTCSMGREHCVP